MWKRAQREKKDGSDGLLERTRERKAHNHVFDISVSGERERMGEKKMNWQGIRGLKRKTASLKMLSLLNVSGRKWEEDLWSERKMEKVRKKEMWEGKRKEKWENPPTLTSLLFLKMTLQALRMEWRISGCLGFTSDTHTNTDTHTLIQKTKHIHILSLQKSNFYQPPPGCLLEYTVYICVFIHIIYDCSQSSLL